METWTGPQAHDRYHRHVRRARLSVPAGSPVHRLAFAVEESLRLASLPGENEGRSYYFRRLRVRGLAPNGDRRDWLERFQRALQDEAQRAVHGQDPRAASAPAVFFRSREEALGILLARVVAREPTHEWFWPAVRAQTGARTSEADGIASRPAVAPAMVPAILEALRSLPAAWMAVAAAIFDVPAFDVVRLIEAIPPSLARDWIEQMETAPARQAPVEAVIPRLARPAVQEAARVFGIQDARVLWLTALAVVHQSPADLIAGTAPRRARAILEKLAAKPEIDATAIGGPSGPAALESPEPSTAATAPVALLAEAVRFAAAPAREMPLAASPQTAGLPVAEGTPRWTASPPHARAESAIEPAVPHQPAADAPVPESHQRVPPEASAEAAAPLVPPPAVAGQSPIPWYCSGLATSAAGLFFLLNALERIGLPNALSAGIAWAAPDFVPRVLDRLAAQAGVSPHDPVRLWLSTLLSGNGGNHLLAAGEAWWPANLRLARAPIPLDGLVRAWALGARRWCWRHGKLGLREIVARHGVFSATRTDLDISLPLDSADVRVRLVGLDLDPGWLPWFGRVVRFHYLHRGEFYG